MSTALRTTLDIDTIAPFPVRRFTVDEYRRLGQSHVLREDHRVEVYTEPTGPDPKPGYRRRQDFGPDEEVTLVLDGREITHVPVRDLLS